MPSCPLARSLPFISALLAAAALLPLAGCGMGGALPSVDASSRGIVSGVVHGVPAPIVGAAITLYATTSGGYGAAATSLATATTDAKGNFNIDSSTFTCPAGQQAYIVSAGGNPGGGTNNNSLLMAAMGDCASMTTANSSVYISEATTVAAAYALANFTTITGTGATSVVNIGAPAANNAVTPACTGTGATLTCTAAGLKHAFQNAANLNFAASATGNPTGQFYQVPPSNPNGSIPTALLNSLANAVTACTNSTGGVTGDGSYCGSLFAATTPPTTSTASPVTPTTTLQAMLNVAQYPTLTPAQVVALYNVPPGTSHYYSPALTTAPADWSLAISYKGVTIGSTTTAFNYPYFVTLDYGDNVYEANTTTNNAGTLGVAGLSSNGTALFAATPANNLLKGAMLATDTLGHFFLPNDSNTAAGAVTLELSTTNGALVSTISQPAGVPTAATPYGVAVDPSNNVYLSLDAGATQALYMVAPTTGTTATSVAVQAGNPAASVMGPTGEAPRALAFDTNADLWIQLYNNSATSKGVNTLYLADTGSIGTETFATPVTTAESTLTSNTAAYGIEIDGNNNAWVNDVNMLFKVVPGATTAANTYSITCTTPACPATATASSARFPGLDGLGNIFLPDNNGLSSKLWQFYPGTTNFIYMTPCSAPAGATACVVPTAAVTGPPAVPVMPGVLYGPRNAITDSTGSIWLANATGGTIVQIIGPGAPTWPQLSLLKPGVRPQ